MDIKTSVVAILNDKNKIMGTGFVAGENLILTCAHVVEQATAGLNERVTIRFSDNSKTEATVEQSSFSPSYEKDVALLRVISLPQGIPFLPLGNAAGSAGHDFYAYGYAIVADVQGIGARGKIVDIVDNGRLVQLTSQEPDHGMSGGPVLDEQRQVVVGMISKGKGVIDSDQSVRNLQTTFAISMDSIANTCTVLKLLPSEGSTNTQLESNQVIAVPGYPPHYLLREAELQTLARMLVSLPGPNSINSKRKITVLQGMGGTGKSVLASALAQEPMVRQSFPDGVIWLTIGKSPVLAQLFEQTGVFLGNSSLQYSNMVLAKQNLGKLASSKACLVILDDAWDAYYGNLFSDIFVDPRARILITTRDSRIASLLDAQEYKLDMLTEQQCIDLLFNWTGKHDKGYATIAKNLGYLPLAIKLAGARLSFGLTVSEWLLKFQNISAIKTGRKAIDRDDSLETSIELSVDAIFGSGDDPGEKLLYYTFGIFKDDVRIPQCVVVQLWMQIKPGIDEFKCEEIINDLVSLALVERNSTDRTITLHDLLHGYNREKLGDRLKQTHQDLLQSYNPKDIAWHLIENDEYIYFNLSYHMLGAGREAQLFDVLLEAPIWLNRYPADKLRDVEVLLISIWDLYNAKYPVPAEKFLLRWLNQHPKRRKDALVNSKLVAVKCAYKSENIRILAHSLCHRDAIVQDESVRYLFYLSHVHPDYCWQIVDAASQSIVRFGLPNFHIVRVLFPVVMLLLIQQYRHSPSDLNTNLLERYKVLLSSMLKKVLFINTMSKFLFGGIAKFIRTMLVKALKQYVRRLLSHNLDAINVDPQKLRITTNSIEEFSRFFALPEGDKQLLRRFIPYLNRNYGSLLDLKNESIEIHCRGDILSIALVNFVGMGRAYANPDQIFEFYSSTFQGVLSSQANQYNRIARVAESISHAMYSVLDRQKHIKDEWLSFSKELIQQHIDNTAKAFQYGVTSTSIGKYIYYTPMYYGAIWNRVHPNDPIDLIEELLFRATKQNDRALLLYVIASLGERATNPSNYGSILTSLKPYLDTADVELRDIMIMSLATIRNKNAEQVDNFLEINKMRHLGEVVKQRSYDENITELARRFHEFIVDFMADADDEMMEQVVSVTQKALDMSSVDDALEIAIKEIINRMIAQNAFYD
ncbi:MAG: hypothetical protein CVU44_02490 [Chloroflexi bacterium HGW-Chloroflexi-6]|nr:MAG: hypothetical protein CVU44_02490 [Chloroflexi bacterium HGW-Chloroflexi-6]